MLVELGLVERRYKAVSEVLVDGATVTDVARRLGVSRQTVHTWLRRHGNGGMADLADRSSRPDRCPHQTPAELELGNSNDTGGAGRSVTLTPRHAGWIGLRSPQPQDTSPPTRNVIR
jgi:transposase-like protein